MIDTVTSVLIAVAGVGFLILVHEFGHFLVAKIFGMRVEEFSIGFGRYLWSRRVGETVYGVSLVPLGGYVRVTGMHEEEFKERVEAIREERRARSVDPETRLVGRSAIPDDEIVKTPRERLYFARPVWQRVLFIVSGVTMNVVAAFVMLVFVGMQGYFEPTTVIARVEESSGAAVAGVQVGDRIVTIDGRAVDEWQAVRRMFAERGGRNATVRVERDGTEFDLVGAVGVREDGSGVFGVGPEGVEVEPGLFEALGFGAARTGELFTVTFRGVGMMFTGEVPLTGREGLAGPVGIVSISSEAVRGGYFLNLLAFISVQLAILNMLPLLPLDGGHVVFNLLEKVLGRSISLRTFERVSAVGISVFLLLLVVATGNDLTRLFTGGAGL